MKETDIEWEQIHSDDKGKVISFETKIGKVNFSYAAYDIIEKVKEMPVETIVQIMGISPLSLQKFLIKKRDILRAQLIELLSKDWYCRETGEVAELIDHIGVDPIKLLNRLKSKQPPSLEYIIDVIEAMTGENTELYLKEESI